MKKRGRVTLLTIFFFCLFSLQGVTAHALPVTQVVRVAFPQQEGLTFVDEEGKLSGYTYEYLEEIAQYTGWRYEFIRMEDKSTDGQLLSMMEMVENGEIDLMGGMLYGEQLDEQYDYTSQSYGVVDTVLQIPYEVPSDFVVNSQISQVIRVAARPTAKRSQQELEDYSALNLMKVEYVWCASTEEQIQAVRDGRADALLNTSLNYLPGLRIIARFAQKPFYFVTGQGRNTDLMIQLNGALQQISQTDPNFSSTLYEKYFTNKSAALWLTQSEEEYLSSAGILRAGLLRDQPPFQYEKEGASAGIAADLLELIAQKTGLSFEMVLMDSPEELYAALEKGDIDLIASTPYLYDLAQANAFSMTRPYLTSAYALLMRPALSEDSLAGKRMAVSLYNGYEGGIEGERVECGTMSECIEALMDGRADYTYVDGYMAQYYLNQGGYRNFKIVLQPEVSRQVSLAVSQQRDRTLLSILNKAILSIPDEEMEQFVYRNTSDSFSLSLGVLVERYPWATLGAVGGFLSLVILFLLLMLYQRGRANRRMEMDLQKHLGVYEVSNDYYFEYDYHNDKLFYSLPASVGGEFKSRIMEVKPDTEEEQARRKDFIQLITGRPDGVIEIQGPLLSGEMHWQRITLKIIRDDRGVPAYSLGRINLIDEEKEEKQALLEKAQRDSLTWVYNAQSCRDKVVGMLKEKGDRSQGAMLMIDVDFFKSVNDRFGHPAGDAILRQVAQVLKSSFRAGDVVGRPGGDEFQVYMSRVQDLDVLKRKCEAILLQIHKLALPNGAPMTVSIGAALARDGDDYDALYRRADSALYRVKNTGRGGYLAVR